MSAAPAADELVVLARITKPRGNKGEVAAQDLCEDLERFAEGTVVSLRRPDGSVEPATIEWAWDHQGRLVIKFEGVASIGDAERLRGSEICIPYGDLGPAPEGEHYYVDLIGCEVLEEGTGRELGKVEAIQEPGGSLLLEIRRDGKELLVPYVPEICVAVDVAAKRITARLPEGLEDLNE
ncbi:MAG: 16S rRNA processing protein RimM [Acidobacteria bacterium]|nr:16S rRNA processing protein RimM [Acidobacteriota bacterium]